MKILALGDIMGRPGRKALVNGLARAREQYSPDFVIVNGENIAGGFGITKKIFAELIDVLQIDCITMGNHWMDKPEAYDLLEHPRLVFPGNMYNIDFHKSGYRVFDTPKGGVVVANMIGKVFMKGENRCPFMTAEKLFDVLPSRCKVRVLDLHGEATSEKQAMGQFLRGKFSLVYGTHSHVPTADSRVFPEGTGFVTDLGMTGPYDSVIGIHTEAAILRMRTSEKKKFEPASTPELWFVGVLADIEENTGKCLTLDRICWRDVA